VVRLSDETTAVGGAGNVALNLASHGLATSLAGATGDDAPAPGGARGPRRRGVSDTRELLAARGGRPPPRRGS